MSDRVTIEGGKYTFYVPDGDFRVHVDRHGVRAWVVIEEGSKAVHALASEVTRLRAALVEALVFVAEFAPSFEAEDRERAMEMVGRLRRIAEGES